MELDKLAEEPIAVLAGENEEVFEELLRLNGSSLGARLKIVAQVSTDKRKDHARPAGSAAGFAHWMIKFPSSQDARDVGRRGLDAMSNVRNCSTLGVRVADKEAISSIECLRSLSELIEELRRIAALASDLPLWPMRPVGSRREVDLS